MEVVILNFVKVALQIIIYILKAINIIAIDMDNKKSAVNLLSKHKTELNIVKLISKTMMQLTSYCILDNTEPGKKG